MEYYTFKIDDTATTGIDSAKKLFTIATNAITPQGSDGTDQYFGLEVLHKAEGVDMQFGTLCGQDNNPISVVEPQFLPYAMKGCTVAVIGSPSLIQDWADENCTDYETLEDGNKMILFGTMNSSKTDFNNPTETIKNETFTLFTEKYTAL